MGKMAMWSLCDMMTNICCHKTQTWTYGPKHIYDWAAHYLVPKQVHACHYWLVHRPSSFMADHYWSLQPMYISSTSKV